MEQPESSESLIRRICRSLQRTDSEFALFFVLVNLPAARKELARQVIAQTARPVVELSVPKEGIGETTLDGWLLPRLEDATDDSVVFLHDLDRVLPAENRQLRHFLQQVNWRRSALAAIKRPLVIWLPRYALDNLAEYAPDFYDWYSNVYEFASPKQELARITDGFISEFGTDVHPASRLSRAEKQEWLHTLTVLLDEHPDRTAYRAKLLYNAGWLHDAIGNLDNALGLYKQALKIHQELDYKKGKAETLNNISHIHYARGDLDTALKYLEQALEIAQEIGDKKEAGAALNNISGIYRARGDDDTALKYLNQSLAIQREIGDRSGEGTTLNNISQIYDARGDLDTALKYLEQALEIQREIGDKAGLCATLFNMGHIHRDKGEEQKAMQTWVRVYLSAKEIGLAEELQALEKLAEQLGLEGGLDGWEKLATRFTDKKNAVP